MITRKELKDAYPAKKIVFKRDKTYHRHDTVKLRGAGEIRLDTLLHMTFLKDEVESEYFDMTLLHKIGESDLFKEDSISTIAIANSRPEENSKLKGFLTVAEGKHSVTFTFLAGGK